MTRMIMALLVVCMLGACDNSSYFDLTNPPEFPWLNVSELERGAVAPYNLAFSSGWGNFFGIDQLLTECMTDIVYLIPNTSAGIPYNEMYYRTTDVEISHATNAFRDGYLAIGACNSVIDFLDKNNDLPYPNPTQDDIANIKRIKGEAYFMRAYSYFHLAKRHCPTPSDPKFNSEAILPLRNAFPESVDEANKPDYVSTRAIYDQIVADLKEAINMLPTQYDAAVHNPAYANGRANRYAAAALLARVQFYLGNHSDALTQLDFVIGGPYNLSQDPIEAFNRDDASQGDEVIMYAMYFDRALNSTQKVATSINYSDYRAVNGGRGDDHRRCSWHQFTFSNETLKDIGWMDDDLNVTEEALSDKRYQQLYWRLEPYRGNNNDDPRYYDLQYKQVTQPRVYGDKYYRGAAGQFTNVPVIRLAEMYLTRAIIHFKAGAADKALNDLNVVRKRAGLASLSTVTEQDIHNERIKEMAFEGDRLSYLQALGMPINPGEREDVAPVSAPYENLYWKIPQSELDFKE